MTWRQYVYIFCFCLFLAGTSHSASVVQTLGDLKEAVRLESGMHDTSHLPDSTLEDLCNRALLWTSVDIGGKEGQVKFNTAAGQAFYSIADSIAQVVHATLISGSKTYTIKAWYPEFIADSWPGLDGKSFTESFSAGSNDDENPIAYNYWSDTLQLIPIPQKVDSIYLKVYLEHTIKDTSDTNSVQLRPAYTEAAAQYAIYLTYKKVRLFEEAAIYRAEYEKLKANLKAAYTRKINAARSGN